MCIRDSLERVRDITQRIELLRLFFFRSHVICNLDIVSLVSLIHHKVNLQLLANTFALFILIEDIHDTHINIVACLLYTSKLLPMLPDSQECLSRIKETIPKAGNIASYIQRNSQYPIYQNTDIVYFDEAVKGLEAQLKDLEKAQKFIFMEYHAIEDAEAWHKICLLYTSNQSDSDVINFQ